MLASVCWLILGESPIPGNLILLPVCHFVCWFYFYILAILRIEPRAKSIQGSHSFTLLHAQPLLF